MLKAYVLGFVTAAVAVVLVAVVWLGTEPSPEPGLLWGGKVYRTEQEFKGYLKSKGLSYKVWLAKYPGAAPWEPDEFTIGAITVRASTKAREDWVVRLPLAAIGLMVTTGCVLLLLRLLRSARPRLATGPVAFSSAVLTVLLVAAVWFGTHPRQEPGLLWGGKVYTTRQEFNGYLKSKGLTYKAWLARNPGAAPWEPAPARGSPQAREDWLARFLLASAGLVFAIGCGMLLFKRVGRIRPRLASGRPASDHGPALSVPASPVGKPAAGASSRGLTHGLSRATGFLRVAVPRYGDRIIGAARAEARRLPELVRDRNISIGYAAFGLIAAVIAGVFAVLVASLLSS
ncbi:MAG: hypothetical protein H0V68_02300 [Actinobacteria bacterium]|nr:hypothetical protein [Actinomycetota bacterium]